MPDRGILRGNPLYPFLLILCVDALVHIMKQAELREEITRKKLTRNCPALQHLMFADDSLFLFCAPLAECTEFLNCLELCGRVFGQEINFQKSSIMLEMRLILLCNSYWMKTE